MLVVGMIVFGLVIIGLVVWVLVQNTQDQKKNEALETQLNEVRRALLGLSSAPDRGKARKHFGRHKIARQLWRSHPGKYA